MMMRAALNDAPSFYGIDCPCIYVIRLDIFDPYWLFCICALIF